MAPAAELLAFARMHLDEGRASDGVDLLAPATVDAMQRPRRRPVPGEAQALGWTVPRWGDLTCLGQDADTFGQRAMLRIVPERTFAICVMANSPAGAPLGPAAHRPGGRRPARPPARRVVGLADRAARGPTAAAPDVRPGLLRAPHERLPTSRREPRVRGADGRQVACG